MLGQSDQKTYFLFEYYLLSRFHYEETNDGCTFLYLFRLLVCTIIHISQRIVAINSIRVINETKSIAKTMKEKTTLFKLTLSSFYYTSLMKPNLTRFRVFNRERFIESKVPKNMKLLL